MPRLWIKSAVVALALVGPGLAQEAVLPDSLNPTLAAPDSLGQATPPPPADSLVLPALQPDSLSLPAFIPVAPPAAMQPDEPSPAPVLALPPGSQSPPKHSRYQAQRSGFFTTRTLWGAACLAGSVVLYNKGSDYRQKANALYLRYEGAADPTEIERLYQRTTNQDTKGQVCWALGAALAVNGARLLLTRETEVTSSARPFRSSLQMILAPKSLRLRVYKWL